MSHALDLFFSRCEETVEYTDFSILRWLQSHRLHQPYRKPFELVTRTASARKFYMLWKRLVFFCFRFWRLGGVRSEALFQRRLSAHQEAQLTKVWYHPTAFSVLEPVAAVDQDLCNEKLGCAVDDDCLSHHGLSSDISFEECFDSDSAESDASDNHSLSPNVLDGVATPSEYYPAEDEVPRTCGKQAYDNILSDILASLSFFLVSEEFSNGRASSALLIYFSSVLGLRRNGATFDSPGNYTSKLAGIIYCSRLLILEATLPAFDHAFAGWPKRPRDDQHDRLNHVRRKYLCMGCASPLDEIISLRDYGRAIASGDGPTFRVEWNEFGDQLSWDGHEMTILQFRQIAQQALTAAVTGCDKLMYGWRPEIRLGQFKDRMSNAAKGYSFVNDSGNGLQDAYLELSRRACLDLANGLLTDSRWDYHAVQRYFKLQAETLEQIMLVCYILGGQSPRGTELFSLQHQNSPIHPRGVYIYNNTIVLVTRYNKARRKNNNEFQVARFLPPSAAKILFKYLVYIVPFVNMLRRECLGTTAESSRLLFENPLRPHEPLSTPALTKALRDLTSNVSGTPVGVGVFRQLSIAITEKHVTQISRPFDRDKDRGAEANPTFVFAWQSGHRPSVRNTTYGLDGAFPDSLQPALLRCYEWASHAWHEFLQIYNMPSGDIRIAQWGAEEVHLNPTPFLPKAYRLHPHPCESIEDEDNPPRRIRSSYLDHVPSSSTTPNMMHLADQFIQYHPDENGILCSNRGDEATLARLNRHLLKENHQRTTHSRGKGIHCQNWWQP